MCQCQLFLLGATLTYLVITVTSFNIESFHYAIYQEQKDSMFGFTVALHNERNRGWLLVGAPEAQSRIQPIQKSGVVFKCPIDRDNSCEEIPFDRSGSRRENGTETDNKNNQWFGATLSSSGRYDGKVVACAPRYIWYAASQIRRDPVGTCYVSNGVFSSFNEYSPCRTSQWGYHRQGSCQAGFSAAINSEGDRVFIGAPGSWYWQGQMYSVDGNARFSYTPGLFGRYGSKGQVFQMSTETKPPVFSTKEGTFRDDDSYLGYSSVVGDFTGEGAEGVAVGMPRGANLHGKVLLYTWDLTNYKNFSSDQLGCYFGYSLAATDIDGDKKTDIVIGAPMYTVPNNEGKYEVGRIYIIYNQGTRGAFTASYVIDGFKSKSRFGHALGALGDINQDGYGDFAVGAPYDGPLERGAVYIYHGSEKGVRKTYSQVIYAEDITYGLRPQPGYVGESHPETFGFSVTGGLDLDGNDYPDFGVGSYLSSTAVFFRSRPVVRVEAFVKFLTPGKQIDIKEPHCRLRDGTRVACTSIDFCVKYTGKGIPPEIFLDVQYILDTKQPKRPRMAFIDTENTNIRNNTIRLQKDKSEHCERKQVYIRNDLYDKLTALEAEVKYWMREEMRQAREIRNPNSVLEPILDLNSPPVKKDAINIKKDCGPDNICIPDLSLVVESNVQRYLFGSRDTLNLTVIVNNNGEDSYGSTLVLEYPDGIYFKQVKDLSQHHVLCSPSENRTIKCDIGNPLPAGSIAKFDVLLQPYYKEGLKDTFVFDISVNSTNPEDKQGLEDNHKSLAVKIWADSHIELRGASHPPDLYFTESNYPTNKVYKEDDIGPQVIHTYFLRNLGPLNVEQTVVLLAWPHATLEGEDFLYLLEQPHTLGNVKCELAPVNYMNITIDEYFSWERINVNEKAAEFSSHLSGGSITSENGIITSGIEGGPLNVGGEDITALVAGGSDASIIKESRHNQSSYGEGLVTTTFSEYETNFRNGVPYTTVTNTTTIRDSKGNIVNTYVVKGKSDHHIYGQFNGPSSGKIDQGGRITTTHTKYETRVINGVPVTTVTNTTTVSDAITGKILSSHTVSGDPQKMFGGGRFNYSRNYQTQYENTQGGTFSQSGSSYYEKNNQFYGNREPLVSAGYGPAVTISEHQSSTYRPLTLKSETGVYESNIHNYLDSNQNIAGNQYEKKYESSSSRYDSKQQDSREYNSDSAFITKSNIQQTANDEEHSQTGYIDSDGVYHSYKQKNLEQNFSSNRPPSNQGFAEGLALNTGYRNVFTEIDSHNQLDVSPTISNNRNNQQNEFVEKVTITGSYDPLTGKFIPDGRISRNPKGRGESSGEIKSSRELSQSGGTYKQKYGGNVQRNYQYNRREQWSGSRSSSSREFEGRDNVPTDRPSNEHRYLGRKKREILYEHALKQALECHSTKCLHIQCTVGRLEPEKEVVISIRGRLNARILKNITTDKDIKFSTKMAAKITRMPYFGSNLKTNITSFEVETRIPGPEPEKSDEVPLWIVILSAIAGALILLLAILALYKLGFFKRNRPSNAPERQPLNRNGYHQGDEAL